MFRPDSIWALFTWKRFQNVFDRKCKLFFMDTRFVYTKMVKTRTKTFSLRKCYPKWKLLKTQQTKRSVNAENANVEKRNAEKVFYQAWSSTKVGVDSAKPSQKRSSCSWCCCFAVWYSYKWIRRLWRNIGFAITNGSCCSSRSLHHMSKNDSWYAYSRFRVNGSKNSNTF